MSDKHTYCFTYTSCSGDVVTGEAEVQVKYTFRPGRPAMMYLRNGDPGYPAEDPEIEIVDVVVEDWPGPVWRTATEDEFERFSEYALDKRFDEMVEEALEDRQAAECLARESEADLRAEARRIFGDV